MEWGCCNGGEAMGVVYIHALKKAETVTWRMWGKGEQNTISRIGIKTAAEDNCVDYE